MDKHCFLPNFVELAISLEDNALDITDMVMCCVTFGLQNQNVKESEYFFYLERMFAQLMMEILHKSARSSSHVKHQHKRNGRNFRPLLLHATYT